MKKTNNSINSIYYVWFHHMALSSDSRKYITKIINEHNYLEFMRLRKLQEQIGEAIEFLPRFGYVINEDGTSAEEVDITVKENFFKVRVCDCECG